MKSLLTPLLLGLSLPCWLPAEVVDSAANGFTVRQTMSIQAPPAEVYQKLVRNVGDWWSAAHTFSHDAHNLSIDDKPGGCFCEKLPGGGVQHLQVAFALPGKTLLLRGGMGPLMSLGVTGGLEISLSPEGQGSKLVLTYSVGGYIPKGADTWAKPVDGMLAETFTRFKTFVETGKPEASK
ncbi:MAG: polyketide cyclase/dehydrase [Bryobacterales bacterium]|jgi:uncharacterized protein YndB with AHSA1/START domain|nr:polyketide cyclase/dehydrase [Bryobacterales bacterium]